MATSATSFPALPSDANREVVFFEDACEELRCVVCRCVLIDPRVLHCQHIFCLRCLFSQVQYDRGERLRITCPFRCLGETVTLGDIRTVQRIPLLSNVVHLVRKRLMEVEERASRAVAPTGAATRVTGRPGDLQEDPPETEAATDDAPAEKVMECEWCSTDTASYHVCPDCTSRLCNRCRGPFSAHHFLCTGLRQQAGGRSGAPDGGGVLSPLARAFQGAEAELDAADGASADGAHHARTFAAIQQPQDLAVGVRHFPFLVLPKEIQHLVEKHMIAQQLSPLSVHIVDLQKIRLVTKQTQVQCSQSASGFSTNYEVIPTLAVGPYELDLTSTRWGYGHRGTDVLLFLANVLRVTHKTLDNLLSVCREVNVVLGELRSQARKALIEDNQGFRVYGIHVLQAARQYLAVASVVLSFLVRIRFLEGIMGDCIVNRYHQIWAQRAPSEKHALRTRCLSFLTTDMELGGDLDVGMRRIASKCDDLKEYLQQLARELEEQQCQYVLRMQRARQPPRAATAPPCPSAKGVPDQSTGRRPWFSAGGTGGARRAKIPAKREGASDPVSALYADHTFLGQLQEREHSVRGLTLSVLVGLETCLQLRHWTWYFSNTTFRECGVGEEREETLLLQEKSLQLLCDAITRLIHKDIIYCYLYQGAVSGSERASTFEFAGDALSMGLRRDTLENTTMFDFEAFNVEGSDFQKLRESVVALESDEQFFENARSFDNQSRLRDLMCNVMESHYDVHMRFFTEWAAMEERQQDELWELLQQQFEVAKPNVETFLVDLGFPFPALKTTLFDTDEAICSTCAPRGVMLDVDLRTKGRRLHQTDFRRRSAAFGSCVAFGQMLVDVANGSVPLRFRADGGGGTAEEPAGAAPEGEQPGEPDEQTVEFLQSMAAPCLFPGAPIPEPGPAAAGADRPLGVEGPVSGRCSRGVSAATSLTERPRLLDDLQFNKEELHGLPMSFRCFLRQPHEEDTEREEPEAVEAEGAAAGQTEGSKGKRAKGLYETSALTFCQERLFAVDDDESNVTLLRAEPVRSDPNGFLKASVQFKKQFRFAPNKTTTVSEVSVTVPFYVGTYNYKNSNLFHYFFVDGQTGQVWLTPPEEDSVLFTSKVTRVIGSPLFFIAFNAVLARFALQNTKMLTI
ncbi:hypothetical protein STCU_07735 [Strigomonas culicis]|uniref:RING-type domain-containing protein n=1 Tax=Strigomonas culicis TaxID=28005 RepID=S9U3J8_9TRYP|nr:hypothetical protein STCU_07735 [Strigomonas culicis]|eukprot:EPY23389.1 hypothetical protein STCU_07735 [Strigomonas culicis]